MQNEDNLINEENLPRNTIKKIHLVNHNLFICLYLWKLNIIFLS